MIPAIPWYLELITLATSLTIAASVWSILSSAASRSGLAPATQRRVRAGVGVFLATWLGAVLILAPAPASLLTRDRFYLTPLIPLFLLVPPTLVFLALWLAPAFRRVLAATSVPAVIGVQLYRFIGAEFVILLGLGQLPAYFAVPAGWGDIAVGVTAPLVALALVRGMRGGRTIAALWNVLGLLDLVVAVGMGSGLLAPVLVGSRVAPAPAMGIFPLFVVPAFAVPVSVLLHLLALGRLQGDVRLGSARAPWRPAEQRTAARRAM
jgi:hypothetical protein